MLLMVFRSPRRIDIPGIEVASVDAMPPIEGKIVVVVGDKELAERLKVAYMTEEEAEKFLEGLKQYLSQVNA